MAVTATETAASPVAKKNEQPQRKSNPGVRVIGGRVYDPSNGKTCHQCRQKTLDFAVSCTALKKEKPCPIKYCFKCLLNRYGENADEMSALGNWRCPKCREICNCSFCMKRKGEKPTGNMARTAKERGFSSVSDMLRGRGPNVVHQPEETNMALVVFSVEKPEAENVLTGDGDANIIYQENPNSDRKPKRKRSKMMNENSDNGSLRQTSPSKKAKASKETVAGGNTESHGDLVSTPLASEGTKEGERYVETCKDAVVSSDGEKSSVDINLPQGPLLNISLPQGTLLTTVAGIELSAEDVGNALQFLEFCAAFGEVIGTKKAQAESVIRELQRGRAGRGGQYSSVGRIHFQLLSLIQPLEDESPSSSANGKHSWLQALGQCISESECPPKDIPLNSFSNGSDEYEKLDFSTKLRILMFLCDEALQTTDLRDYMEKQNLKYGEEKKEAKEKLLAAKEKEKEVRQSLKDELAKMNEKDGSSLVLSMNESISQLKAEVARARAEVLEAGGDAPKKRQVANVLRTEPILIDDKGHAFWELNGYNGEPNILLQDVATVDAGEEAAEKWFMYDPEQKEEIEKYIILKRPKRTRSRKTRGSTPTMINEGIAC